MGLMIENVTVEDIVLLILRFSPISTIPPMFHTHFKFKYKPFYVILTINNVIKYEGWNFNSGNYLFTTDTK